MRATLGDLAYWPWQHAAGFFRLWQFSGFALAAGITLANLFGTRRNYWVRLYGFVIEIRSGTPDLAVALDSLGGEFSPVLGLADPGGLIIDAGGYIGTAALKLAAAFPQSQVICLEPARANLALLRRNVAGVANITVIAAALAASEGEAVLRDPGSGEWGFSLLDGGSSLETVPTVTVEGILAREGRDRLFLLKLDVEGAEGEILRAGAGWMDRTDILIAELHEKLVPGTEAAFDAATTGRSNRRLPGEKIMSMRRA